MTNDGWGKGDWGKPKPEAILNDPEAKEMDQFAKDQSGTTAAMLGVKASDWGGFPVIHIGIDPGKNEVSSLACFDNINKRWAELDLSEQPFEFDQELEATRIGDLCVHRSTEDVGKWRVTHVHSLYSFMKAVPQGEWSKEQLIAWCKTVQLNWQDYWQVLREVSENQLHLTERQRYSAGILQKHCLQTPVE